MTPTAASQPTPSVGALAFAAVFPTVLTWVYFRALSDAGAAQQVVYAIGKLIQFGPPIYWVVRHGRRFGGRAPGRGRHLAIGATVAIAASVAGYAAYAAVLSPAAALSLRAAVAAKTTSLGILSPLAYGAAAAFYAIGHSLLEEVYWRGFVAAGLCARLGPVRGILVSSAAFAAHHVIVLGELLGYASWLTYALAVAVAGGGAFWAWLWRRSQGLVAPWLSHGLVDAAIFALGALILYGAS